MSTRANIVIKDGERRLYFYRHSDGYPDGPIAADLNKLVQWAKDGRVRTNLTQFAGWLVVLGHMEEVAFYNRTVRASAKHWGGTDLPLRHPGVPLKTDGWSATTYMPTDGISPWADYVYTLDLDTMTVTRNDEPVCHECRRPLDEADKEYPADRIADMVLTPLAPPKEHEPI